MTDTTDRAPWCPRCGGEMVHENGPHSWLVECFGCGFGFGERDWMNPRDSLAHARRLIRAELARQALEMRAHSQARNGVYDEHGTWTGALVLDEAASMVMDDYIRLGAHPLRLPGEGA